jgi:hypothetical protein
MGQALQPYLSYKVAGSCWAGGGCFSEFATPGGYLRVFRLASFIEN